MLIRFGIVVRYSSTGRSHTPTDRAREGHRRDHGPAHRLGAGRLRPGGADILRQPPHDRPHNIRADEDRVDGEQAHAGHSRLPAPGERPVDVQLPIKSKSTPAWILRVNGESAPEVEAKITRNSNFIR